MTTEIAGRAESGEPDIHTGPATAPGHRRDIQVVRAAAVTAVVLFHCGVLLPGGFVGVDVFFVVSGFVIGRGLLGELGREGSVGLRAFWWRRANRLLPALAATLFVVVLMAPLFGPVGAVEVTPRTAVAASLSVANLYLQRVATDGYFDVAVELNPLLHTWSLSLEEQIYLVVPMLLGAAWAIGRRRDRPVRSARVAVTALALTSFAACVVLTGGSGTAARVAFFSPLTRVWEFAVGLGLVLLPAAVLRRLPNRVVLVVGGAAMVAVSMVAFSASTPFPGVAALLPVAGTAAVLLGGRPVAAGEPPARSWRRPVEAIGDISYGWYLWHWPLIVFAAAAWPLAGSAPRLLAAAAALLPAWASSRFLERRGPRVGAPSRSALLRVGLFALAPLVAVLLTRPVTDEVARRSDTAWFSAARELHADQANECNSTEPLGRTDPGRCRWGAEGDGGRVVLVGDSNAGQFSEAMIGAAQRTDAELTIASTDGCPFLDAAVDLPLDGPSGADCQALARRTVDELVADPPDVVVIANATDYYLSHQDAVVTAGDDAPPAIDVEARAEVLGDGLRSVMAPLADAGIRVALVHVVPKPWAAGLDLDSRGCSALVLSAAPTNCRMPPYRADNAVRTRAIRVEARAADDGGAETWDIGDELCPDDDCEELRDGEPVWAESFHISVPASEQLAPRMAELLGRTR